MAEQKSNIMIGSITDVRGDGMTARISGQYTTDNPIIQLGDEQVLAGQLGSYVVIRQGSIGVLAQVFKMWEGRSI